MRPTAAQLHALRTCEDHKILILGGYDDSGIGRMVIRHCAHYGWLRYKSPSGSSWMFIDSEWILTDEGRKVLEENR